MDHPEKLLGENPLFEGISPFIPMSKLPKALLREPLANVPWQSIEPELREPYLGLHTEHFFPTSDSIEIVASIQASVRAGLMRRNPLAPQEHRRINQLALLDGDVRPDVLQSLASPASGGIVAAETGAGKTSVLRRALELIAPEQVIVHGHSVACGWSRMVQISYLYVDLPSNGSRGGLITRILGGVDAIVGTDYVGKHQRLRNIDQSLLLAMKVLSIHRVGLLVLDEGQQDNFEECAWQREFVLFFLCLMNLGIPIVLSGHPMAFSNLESVAQVMRRFSDIGFFKLSRALRGDESWWRDALVPGVMRFNLCESIEDVETIQRLSQPTTAGIPGLFAARWVESQRIALRRGGAKAQLLPADFEIAGESPRCIALEKIARWLGPYTPSDSGYTDLSRRPSPEPDSAGETTASTAASPGNSLVDRPDVNRALKKLADQEKRDVAKRTARQQKNKELLEQLSPEDLRNAQGTLGILTGLEAAQQELFNREG